MVNHEIEADAMRKYQKTPLFVNLSLFCLVVLCCVRSVSGATAVAPAPPELTAKAHFLQDFHSGKILAMANADERLPPASLTKLMTAYVVFKELRANNIALDDQVLISKKAWGMKGSLMFIEVDKRVSVEDLLQGMIIQSGNDASVALAEHVAGTESAFADMMNEQAHQLGMNNSKFKNSSGMPAEDHYSTARDIGTVSRAIVAEFAEYYKWYSMRQFTFNNIVQYNRNKMLRDPTVDGLKTGYTVSAGYCLVSSAVREGMRLVAVVLGTKSKSARIKESQTLLNYGFRYFETHHFYKAGSQLHQARIWKGMQKTASFGIEQDIIVTVPKRHVKRLKARLEVDAKLLAPIVKGKPYGVLMIDLDGSHLVERPLIALQDIPLGNLWQQVQDTALLWLE